MRAVTLLRRHLTWVVASLVLSILAVDSAVLADRAPASSAAPAMPISVALDQNLAEEDANAAERRKVQRDDAVRAMFARRADAVLKRDRAAFLADLYEGDRDFVARQEQVFDSLGKLDFGSWSYVLRDETYSVGSIDWKRYRGVDDIALPVLTLHYALKDYDKRPVVRRVVYTVVQREGRWMIANDRDLEEATSSGTSVRRDPWENGPIIVARGRYGLVIGHPADADAIASIQREVEAGVKHVSSIVGRAWGERPVVILPADHEELEYILENPEVPYEFGAVADPESTTLRGEGLSLYAGARVVINPDNFNAHTAFTKRLIRHELAHVATFERTGPLTPKWLIEGLAEYVGNHGSDLPTRNLASSLARLVDASGVPTYLPLDSDFGLIGEAGVGYDSGWMLCRYIASRWGQRELLRFFDAMGSREGLSDPTGKLDRTLRSVLKTDETSLLKAWRPYVRAAVGDVETLVRAPGGRYRGETFRTDEATLTKGRRLKRNALRDAGMERGALGAWWIGDEGNPQREVRTLVVVSRDDKAAQAVGRLLAQGYEKFDRGTPIPNGRLYLVGVVGSDDTQAIALIRQGIATYEIRVTVRGHEDPSAEARALAAAQYRAAEAA